MRRLVVAVVLVLTGLAGLPGAAATAGESNFTMGNVDRAGSRAISGDMQGNLSASSVRRRGLQVAWASATQGSVAGAPVTFGTSVIVGDFAGYMDAFDRATGAMLWTTCVEAAGCDLGPSLFSGILGSPLVKDGRVYMGTLSGSLVALDAVTGAILWRHTPQVTAPYQGIPVDSVYGGPIAVRDMVVYALAPNDEMGLPVYGRGAVLAVNRVTGAEVWRRPLISDADFAAGSSGAAVWNTTPAYSPELDLLFVGTGQDTNPAGGQAGSDSFFAIRASDGSVAWRTQVRTGDTYSWVLPYDPLHPTDTDIGDSPAVFRQGGRLLLAAGDKRGIFWVLDARTGRIVNNQGVGLDMFAGNLPGPGVQGGFNLDSGFFTNRGTTRHFGVFSDMTNALQEVLTNTALYPDHTCTPSVFPGCPVTPDSGNVVVLDARGEHQVCRFSVPGTELFSPLYVGGMILVRAAQGGRLYALDASTCGLITSLALPTGPSGGASLSVAGGTIFTGGGFFGAPGLLAIRLGS